MSDFITDNAAKIADRYDNVYGKIRRWVMRHPGATAWMGVGGTIGGFLVGFKFGGLL